MKMKILVSAVVIFVFTATGAYAMCEAGSSPENKIDVISATQKSFAKKSQAAASKAAKNGWVLMSAKMLEGSKDKYVLSYSKCKTKARKTTDQIVKEMNDSGRLANIANDFEKRRRQQTQAALPPSVKPKNKADK